MLRKMIMAALAVAAVGLVAPQAAQAGGGHWGGGGGHWGGGGGHWAGGGGHWGGGWGHGWHGGGFWPGIAIGAGLAGAGYYGAYGYGYPYYGDPYAYGAGYDEGGYGGQCYLVRQRVMTQWGWRVRRAQVCE